MSGLRTLSRRVCIALLASFLGMVIVSLAEGQGLRPKGGPDQLMGSPTDDKFAKDEDRRFQDLMYGRIAAVDPANAMATTQNRAVLDKAAKIHAYRLTWPVPSEDVTVSASDTMHERVLQTGKTLLLNEIRLKRKLPANQESFLKEFGKLLVARVREVLSVNSKPIVRVNAARLLALVAEAEQEEVADTLVELLKDPNESDGVKLYVAQGLRKLFAAGTPGQSVFKNREREKGCILALNEYVSRTVKLRPNATDEEIDAIRYVRREAIRALGQTRFPAVDSGGKPDGRTALLLLRVARKDGLTPEPSMSERLEAAIGVCQLQPGLALKANPYNPDYAAHQLGGFFLDFMAGYSSRTLSMEGAAVPWKFSTIRLNQALFNFGANSSSAVTSNYVSSFVTEANTVLKPIESGAVVNTPRLEAWLGKNPPPNAMLYRGVPDAVVRNR